MYYRMLRTSVCDAVTTTRKRNEKERPLTTTTTAAPAAAQTGRSIKEEERAPMNIWTSIVALFSIHDHRAEAVRVQKTEDEERQSKVGFVMRTTTAAAAVKRKKKKKG